MNRREFSKKLTVAGVVGQNLLRRAEAGELATAGGQNAQASGARPEGRIGPRTDPPPPAEASRLAASHFPPGDYTPFGYLDNPYHTWDLHPSGVLRSVPPLGMGLYFPAGPGGYFDYGRNSIYRSILRLGFQIGERVLFEEDDFRAAGIKIGASHHSKNLLRLDFPVSDLWISAAFFLLAENTLACALSLQNRGATAQDVHAFAVHRLELGACSWWGRDGIAGSFDERDQHAVLRSFAAGPVFILKMDHPVDSHLVASDAALKAWMAGNGTSTSAATAYYPDSLNSALGLRASVPPGAVWRAKILLSRAANERFAQQEISVSGPRAESVYAGKTTEDDRFWSGAPRLEGDFPEHWKNSWVYDFETLRMMVRRPLGVYKHSWDAMQIHAPRNVLAETSIDMWALAYADPDTAKAVLLGQFQDAVKANVPCMREDGTMNMVAADGSECGTSLQWCYPFYCIESVFLRTGDQAWLGKLYPYLARYLDWTLEHRTDAEGWIVAKCSWESGMDASGRFLIQQPTGAELIDFIRVAEIQAAMAHAARSMATYAKLLGRHDDISRWQALASGYADKTRQLFFQAWFYDVDSRSGKPIVIPNHREVTQMAPIMCGVATAEQIQAMTPAMLEYSPRQDYWLEWASLVLPYAESMWRAGQRQPLARALFEIVDRAYRSMDRRELEPEKRLGWPGVSCEYWGQKGAAGGEGYGWGATLPAHIIRSLFGFRELDWSEGKQFNLGPNIPEDITFKGKSYSLRNLHFRGRRFDLRYSQATPGEFRASLTMPERAGGIRVSDEAGQEVAAQWAGNTLSFRAKNHALYRVRLNA
jgi:hypothetical protein